ncbi:MAG: class I SAM-dependent methyltransferase [Actinomycetota bacterium]|nr:class I SAM-dependent methyltransferase [Actinomycetota bacterium]
MEDENRRSEHVPRGYTRPLDSETAARLSAYEALVRRWASTLDLVAPGELERFGRRHLEDALKAAPLIDDLPPGPAVDVGSGAGVPGIPLAIAARRRAWLLLEPRRKRAAFLEEVVRDLALDHVEVRAATAGEAASESPDHVLATARALAPPATAFRLLLPLLRPGGTAIVWVGRSAELPPDAVLSSEGLATIWKDEV